MNDELSLERFIEVLSAASPDTVLETVIGHLETVLPGAAADILLVDYPQRQLRSVSWPTVVSIDNTPAGRAYLENAMIVEENQVWVPLDAHGASLGVLTLLGAVKSEETLHYLASCAVIASRAIIAAERLTDTYRRARRDDRMTLAAELQWSLLPGRGLTGPGFSLAGQLEPALSIRGDSYDWSLDEGQLTIMACNGMGEGTSAALLTSLCVAALRNGRRSGLAFEEQLALMNDSVWAQYGGKQYIEAVVLLIDTRTGAVQVVDAGSPRLYRLRAGKCQPVSLEAQLPVGMFDGTRYSPQLLNLRTGDRLIVVSDGVLTAAEGSDEVSDASLIETVVRTATLSTTAAVRAVLGEVWSAAAEAGELSDDAVVLCLDWHH